VNLGTFETGEGRFELKGGFQESSKSGFGSGVRMRGVRLYLYGVSADLFS
jgi:hypothetical protein